MKTNWITSLKKSQPGLFFYSKRVLTPATTNYKIYGSYDNMSSVCDSSQLGDETSVTQFGWDEEAYSFPVRARGLSWCPPPHKALKRLFPINQTVTTDPHFVRSRKLFQVNRTRTAAYQNSAIPDTQRMLNKHCTYFPPQSFNPCICVPLSYLLTMIVSKESNVCILWTINFKMYTSVRLGQEIRCLLDVGIIFL